MSASRPKRVSTPSPSGMPRYCVRLLSALRRENAGTAYDEDGDRDVAVVDADFAGLAAAADDVDKEQPISDNTGILIYVCL